MGYRKCLLGIVFLGLAGTASASGFDSTSARAIAAQNIFFNTARLVDPANPGAERHYLLAGANQFRTLWTRDLSMSVKGAIAAGQTKAAHDSLEAIFKFQRADGLLPRVIDNEGIASRVILGLLGLSPRFKEPLRGWYETEYDVIAIDSNVCAIWAAGEYLQHTGDLAFARRWLAAAETTLAFIERRFVVDGLISHQPPFSDWEDSVRREGRVALTNIYYVLALRALSEWSELVGAHEAAASYALQAELTTSRVRDYFWIPERGVLRNFEGDDHLTADANLMAVAYSLLPLEQARSVMQVLRASPLWRPMPGLPTYPKYDRKLIGTNVKIAGITGYHDSYHWFWITALAAKAEKAVGNCAGYRAIMDALAHQIASDGFIAEIYKLRKDGLTLRPARSWIYRSEEPFTWNSALYLEAASEGGECDWN